ncbi:protein GREB1 [Callorhinchus milii]|uniref:protein GREB1 n=1 Tax=Callorhinchus milii TaxID=7868 RepID=UPI001C3F7EA6|nr:protein GREB1 [Callorhinchus milii]XP_007895261.2 protein GREB1 [Callorhinchus milii]XP_007895263.2 protein GREB1 [Callorhinchus milii]XP_007895266.2 protein GREB1 [Callorhinchus milii]XP_007895267.2 protein GREB1 [Callorhinchus milii]XP_007895268.2 protein GREB1 [Callorhinchus milii]XP_042189444.1 protein GREB1 [Callorhinchus milii]
MGNSYAGQLKTTRFEEVLHNSIEASLRSNNLIPRPVFSQLYLEAEQQLTSNLEACRRPENEEEEEEDGSESSSPLIPYQMKPPPEGCCTTDGFCQAGKDLRLASVSNAQIEVPMGFLLIGAKSPNLTEHLLVCAVDKRFLPDDNGRNALLGFSGNCVGCGEKGFRYFTEFSNHINLKLTTQPKKQKHLKYYLLRNAQGCLAKGPLICWKGTEGRAQQSASSSSSSVPSQSPESPASSTTAASAETTSGTSQNPSTALQPTGVPTDQLLPRTSTEVCVAHNSRDPSRHQNTMKTNNLSAQSVSRPSVIGTLANSGPPKKRHRGWSPDSPSPAEVISVQSSLSAQSSGSKADVMGLACLTQSCHLGPLLSPMAVFEEPVAVPENLLKICRTRPVIFKGHGNFPYLCGNLNDIVISPLLQTCYKNTQSLPRLYEQHNTTIASSLSVELQILLTVYYLVQLAPDQAPLIEDLEHILVRWWQESNLTETKQYQQILPQSVHCVPPQTLAVSPTQLPWLAKLAASSCKNVVRILDSFNSLAEGLEETFKLLSKYKLQETNFVVIICVSKSRGTESCVVVTGKHQARFLAESMLSQAENLKEISYELVTGKVGALGAFFSTLCPEGDIDILFEKCYQERNGQSSCSNGSTYKFDETTAQRPFGCAVVNKEESQIHPIQLAVARKLLSHICAIADSSTQNLDLGSFEKVDFLILVPPSEVTYQQTVLRVRQSGILVELGLEAESAVSHCAERYVMKLTSEAQRKFDAFRQRALQNPYTLFILIHDHAHWDLTSGEALPQSEASLGLADRILNCKDMKEALNVLTLHVTSFPFSLQTQQTHISPYNEIHWPLPCNNRVDLYHENNKYFGLSEFIDSTRSGHSLPLLRFDSSFEAMVSAMEERFPKLHSAVIRTYILIQHYTAAMMTTAGHSQMKNYSSVETLEIIQSLVHSTGQCPSGHGHMILVRVPSIPLAALAYERLYQVRQRLGLQHRFEIILGNPSTPISIDKHFLTQLKDWQKIEDPDWAPRTYLDLEDLPCILIVTGTDPQGESFPRSVKYCDLRLINSTCLLRATLEQELGLAACYVAQDVSGQTVIVNDFSESDLDKPGSTDNDEDDIAIEAISDSGKKNNVKRQRSYSNHSASSRSSKASSLTCDNEPSPASGQEESAKYPFKADSSNAEDITATREKLKQRAEGAQQKATYELSNPEKHRMDLDQTDNNCGKKRKNRSSRRPSKSFSSCSSFTQSQLLAQTSSQCPRTKATSQPPTMFVPQSIYNIVTAVDHTGLAKSTSFLPHHSVLWASSFHPSLAKMMTCTEQSLYYRQWTLPKPNHMDYSNKTESRTDLFHPRRLLLNGPPQVGKTGAYLQFLSILSRMLIRLMEVDVYDEDEINLKAKEDFAPQQKENLMWPDLETFSKLPFDYAIHDPTYEDASPVYSQDLESNKGKQINKKEDDVYLQRHTTRMRLSKYAAYNTYHHCEQCHEYMGFNPRYQPYESTLHAFTFSCSMLGEEVQLHFIIPKSKEHHFVFSQPGGQLESMRLPLVTDKQSQDCIKSPIFTPSTGRHEHGLFNLYHAMDGANHLHILVIKEYEMTVYKKYWPNHIMLILPSIFNSAGVGAAHFLIKELSYHNLELERNRQEELGIKPQDVWSFIVIADDSCVMWNSLHAEVSEDSTSVSAVQTVSERNVSLKHVLQDIETTTQIPHYALCGIMKWSSKVSTLYLMEPFSRCHLHDFLLLNVDLTQNVQYNQNRFSCDDVDFNLRVHSAGLLICRFNRFSVMKKQISIGGHRTFLIKSKIPDVPMSISPSQYIYAPDSKHTFLAAPAQLLLEKYLQHTSYRLFPLSVKNYSHPVLSVDCYLNLGQEIAVCFVSSRPHSLNMNCSGLAFSGLLLYLCDSFVTASILKKFHFLKGATLCVICQDRSSLRQTVVRLELEDEWQFRLRDEFQTANSREDKPLFFLTGRHV